MNVLNCLDYDALLEDVIKDKNGPKDNFEKELNMQMMKKICDLQKQLQSSEIKNSEQVLII